MNRRSTRSLAAVLCALVAVATLAAGEPASAQTTPLPRPVLLVGGFSSPQWFMDWWASELAESTGTDRDRVVGVELASGGIASNEESANGPILDRVNALYAAHGEQIDIVAVSQGALASRWLLKNNAAARDKVAGWISLSGVNAGGPYDPTQLSAWCGAREDWANWPEVCQEVFYLPPEQGPGGTAWLLALNGGVPTPGNVAYYHVYTELLADGTVHPEAYEPYGWDVPLLGATNVSAQQACTPHGQGDRAAPHAGLWTVLPPEWDVVMTELVIDALHRRPLAIDAAATCADQG